jgi:transposase
MEEADAKKYFDDLSNPVVFSHNNPLEDEAIPYEQLSEEDKAKAKEIAERYHKIFNKSRVGSRVITIREFDD